MIDQFVSEYSVVDADGMIIVAEDADFDDYLRMNKFEKQNLLGEWLTSKE